VTTVVVGGGSQEEWRRLGLGRDPL
jgi:hypothetical protein